MNIMRNNLRSHFEEGRIDRRRERERERKKDREREKVEIVFYYNIV